MIRTLGGKIATREQRERRQYRVSVWDLGKGPYADRGKKNRVPRVAAPVAPAVPLTLCRECDREADVRNYGNYCSRACAKAGL